MGQSDSEKTAKPFSLLKNGDSGRTRTCNPRLRRPVLYPVELRSLSNFLSSVARSAINVSMADVDHRQNYPNKPWV